MGKSSNQTAGYRFKLRYHSGLTYGPIDALLEFRGGDKAAWRGRQTTSGAIGINAPVLWGGDKDQGGIVGTLYLMMGEATQTPNPMLVGTFGEQVAAWRGFATAAFDGLYGSNNPYPQAAAYKVEKILKGWDNDNPWYPAKAVIPLTSESSVVSGYFLVSAGAGVNSVGSEEAVWGTFPSDFIGTADEIARRCVEMRCENAGGCYEFDKSFLSGTEGAYSIGGTSVSLGPFVGIAGVRVTPICPVDYATTFEAHGPPTVGITNPTVVCSRTIGSNAINPAHALYYLRTQSHKGGEPAANIDEASFIAGADKLFAEGFGICVRHDPDQESVEDIENRICKLIGGSVNRSLVDGKLHLELARGDYVLADLPIVTDDDVLDFNEAPTSPEGAVNSVSVRYFDPERKETIITPSADALGLIDEFGLNHQVIDYPEIPTAALATRIATRELMAFITPSRVFDLVCKPTVYGLQPNQYLRLQLPKRGIADMVCVVGDKQGGTLKSGAIRMTVAQAADTLPDFGTVDVEPGVNPSPATPPAAITEQISFEAPYLNVCAALSRADLAALPSDVGYLIAAAEDPASSRDFSVAVDAGAGYALQGDGDWCPTAVINEAADPDDTAFTISAGKRLGEVVVGDVAYWGSELCRVDAIDAGAGTLMLGRGCGDTTPRPHSAGEKIWFYGEGSAHDSTEYTDGETIGIKLLTNTGSAQLSESAAAAMTLTFASRQVRPYAPGRLRFTDTLAAGQAWPASLVGLVVPAWVHRDRVLEADQLLESEAAGVGPEAGTTYSISYQMPPGTEVHAETGITGLTGTGFTFATNGIARIEITAHRDGFESWQALGHTFDYSVSPSAGFPTEAGDFFITEAGDRLVTG